MKEEPILPGLEGIVATQTSICDIDTEKCTLIYRGYEVGELAEKSTFEEVAYLLLYVHLPRRTELEAFRERLSKNREVPGEVYDLFRKVPPEAHPMDLLRCGVSLLGVYDPDREDNSREAELRKAERLIAQIPTLIAAAHRLPRGLELPEPNSDLSHAGNLLSMITGKVPDELSTRVIDSSLIIYAEHELNASTFSARVTASTGSDLHSAIVSAIGTLKGPLHGGATEKAMEMLLQIGEPEKAERWVLEALSRKERIMGFGHRVYRKGDSRARYMKELVRPLGEQRGEPKWYQMAEKIEAVMLREKHLFPNVDFYSAIAYHLLGLPPELYTSLFVAGRIAGWSTHVLEQHEKNRLIRPRSRYIGPRGLRYVPLEEREKGGASSPR
jgi:2-methylcitrate synthase/citrate synthase II